MCGVCGQNTQMQAIVHLRDSSATLASYRIIYSTVMYDASPLICWQATPAPHCYQHMRYHI